MSNKLGVCPCCKENVYDDQLYVFENTTEYHLSCFNYMKAEQEKHEVNGTK